MLRAFAPGVFGDQHGDAPARVLALPGWMRPRHDFATALAGLDAVLLDLPGFGGASPVPAEPAGAAGYAELVAPALEACTPDVVVIGHSFGGRVAVNLATTHRVGALVLTGTPRLVRPSVTSKPALSFRVVRWLHKGGLVSDERMEALRRQRGSEDYRNASGVMRDVLVRVVNEDYEALLPRVQVPVELVWGDDDTAAPLAQAERAQALFGGPAKLTVVPDAGHLTPLTIPDVLRAAVEAHLQ